MTKTISSCATRPDTCRDHGPHSSCRQGMRQACRTNSVSLRITWLTLLPLPCEASHHMRCCLCVFVWTAQAGSLSCRILHAPLTPSAPFLVPHAKAEIALGADGTSDRTQCATKSITEA